jgi:hypothetical protein
MLTEPIIQQLHQLRLAGMAAALEQPSSNLASRISPMGPSRIVLAL